MFLEPQYDFDDVLILPSDFSSVLSRADVDTGVTLGYFKATDGFLKSMFTGITLKIPIIASPMKGIVGVRLIIELARLGGIGILHRFMSVDDYKKSLYDLNEFADVFGVSVSLDDKLDYKLALEADAKIICVDVANGNLTSVYKKVSEINDFIFNHKCNALLMAGNVVTSGAAATLFEAGADLVRVGIGSGALCTTRNYTGIGRPQISALQDCSHFSGIISDGGIRNSGDIVKALAAGADAVMIGTLLARSFESEHNGIIYGMASRKIQEEYFHSVKSIEGLEVNAVSDKTLEDLITELVWGIKSACTYVNANNIDELRSKANFVLAGTGSIKKL